jgi:hypothetical protein
MSLAAAKLHADGTAVDRLTQTLGSANFLAFSHDLKHIAFTTDAHRLYLMNADGTDQHVVKFGAMYADFWQRP